jgi:hypothetical protein
MKGLLRQFEKVGLVVGKKRKIVKFVVHCSSDRSDVSGDESVRSPRKGSGTVVCEHRNAEQVAETVPPLGFHDGSL